MLRMSSLLLTISYGMCRYLCALNMMDSYSYYDTTMTLMSCTGSTIISASNDVTDASLVTITVCTSCSNVGISYSTNYLYFCLSYVPITLLLASNSRYSYVGSTTNILLPCTTYVLMPIYVTIIFSS